MHIQTTGFGYIFGDEIHHDPFHVGLIRDKLTRSLVPCFGDVYDEINAACREWIPATKDGTSITFHIQSTYLTYSPQNGYLSRLRMYCDS